MVKFPPASEVRRTASDQADIRERRLAMRHVSLFYYEQRFYDCPLCEAPMDRAHLHGWFWFCHPCQKTFPLYVLQQLEEEKSHGQRV